jgi:nucleoside 2-deoxyribosyltransferase
MTGIIYPAKTVYLAGPITGLTHDAARYGWRTRLTALLPGHIKTLSPMRGKDMLKDIGVLTSGDDYPVSPLTSAAGITTRDANDVKTCDAMVACFLESSGPSLGTAWEFGLAWAFQKPVIMVGKPDEVNMRHLILQRTAGYRVETLEEAAWVVSLLLTPGL